MRNQDIHKNFEREEIRDFLAQQLEASWTGEAVERLEEHISRLQKRLDAAKQSRAVLALIEALGWEDWDVSDKTSYNSETYFPFVGTKDEHKEFLALLARDS